LNDFVEKINQILIQVFPKVMELLENKRKKIQIPNIEGHMAKNSLFTNIAFTKDYEVNIHENKDDTDLYFILWLRKGICTHLNFGFNVVYNHSCLDLISHFMCLV
jgi:hypothetical protein